MARRIPAPPAIAVGVRATGVSNGREYRGVIVALHDATNTAPASVTIEYTAPGRRVYRSRFARTSVYTHN